MAIRIDQYDPFPSQPKCRCGCPMMAHVSQLRGDALQPVSNGGHCVLCPCTQFVLNLECDADCCEDEAECLLQHIAQLGHTAELQRRVNDIWPKLPLAIQRRIRAASDQWQEQASRG